MFIWAPAYCFKTNMKICEPVPLQYQVWATQTILVSGVLVGIC